MRGKMHDRIDRMIFYDLLHECAVTGFSDNKFGIERGGFKAGRKIVKNDDLLASLAKLPRRVTADVPGAARNHYCLACHVAVLINNK
jgi:hypothetical protein